jgi:hypothetical protein
VNYTLLIVIVVLFITVVILVVALLEHRKKSRRAELKISQIEDVANRYSGIIDLEGEERKLRENATHLREQLTREGEATRLKLKDEARVIREETGLMCEKITREIEAARHERERLTGEVALLRREGDELDEQRMLQDHGLYAPHFDFESSEHYRLKSDAIRSQQKMMVKEKVAAICTTRWAVGGSEVKGRKMSRDNIKLMLRAFNGECDAAVLKVRYNNVDALSNRMKKSFERINKMGEVNCCSVTDDYLQLKLSELFLAHEFREKKQSERDEQRRIKEQMKEEQRALVELEKAQREAEKDEGRYEKALKKARADVAAATGLKHARMQAKLVELERKLAEAAQLKARAISRAQLTRSGHVYVISNIGSFGQGVFKIGMTRRLEPNDRVRELGDASVPFPFDVHAMIYTEDAPTLEKKLHQEFGDRRVNRVNRRKEFFSISLREVADAVTRLHGQIEFTEIAEAEEYRKTRGIEQAQAVALPPAMC